LGPETRNEINNVLFADNFFMTEEAIKKIERLGRITRVDCKTEDDMVEKVQSIRPKVIVSEYFRITERIMDVSQNLKGIGVWGVGYDHIDIEAASERGIYVANTRGSNAESVAEHVFALILNLSRKLCPTDAFIRNGGWVSREETGLPRELVAQDLLGKTIGIIGLGAIGSCVARISKGFGMRIIAYDPYLSEKKAKQKGAELVPLEKLLRESDFTTIHVVLNNQTRGLIGAKELKIMKPTAYLINTSRGQVISEEDLIKALHSKWIAGAGLDVFTDEPTDSKNPILEFDNVLVTPHCAGNSEDALNSTSLMISQEVERIMLNKIPRNLVNRLQLEKRGYLV